MVDEERSSSLGFTNLTHSKAQWFGTARKNIFFCQKMKMIFCFLILKGNLLRLLIWCDSSQITYYTCSTVAVCAFLTIFSNSQNRLIVAECFFCVSTKNQLKFRNCHILDHCAKTDLPKDDQPRGVE